MSKNFIAMYPVINEINAENKSNGTLSNSENSKISFVFRIVAPRIAGSESRNENLALLTPFIPASIPALMVDPDLDIPGRIANACATPTRKDETKLKSFSGLFLAKRVEIKINPVTIRNIDVNFGL